ncbi:RNA polymerase sigma factor [Agaribacter flavus]|uniref:RNA polymerase sigma factor n=1 Tax=Agaribacter flavus TaxID=1902781 RepID=A0ABV7FNR0_9ALTE
MKRTNEQIITEYLVINCQLGDEKALEALLRLWYPKLLAYANSRISDRSKAEDAVQLSFEALTKSISKISDPRSFPKWIYSILQRKCTDLMREHYRQEKLTSTLSEQQQTEHYDVESDEDQGALNDLVKCLSPEHYQLVYLHYLEGLTMTEIAEVIRVPVGTIKSRLYKAREQLAIRLNGE